MIHEILFSISSLFYPYFIHIFQKSTCKLKVLSLSDLLKDLRKVPIKKYNFPRYREWQGGWLVGLSNEYKLNLFIKRVVRKRARYSCFETDEIQFVLNEENISV